MSWGLSQLYPCLVLPCPTPSFLPHQPAAPRRRAGVFSVGSEKLAVKRQGSTNRGAALSRGLMGLPRSRHPGSCIGGDGGDPTLQGASGGPEAPRDLLEAPQDRAGIRTWVGLSLARGILSAESRVSGASPGRGVAQRAGTWVEVAPPAPGLLCRPLVPTLSVL